MAVATQPVQTEEPVTTTEPAAPVANDTAVLENPRKEHRITVAQRIIYLVGGILITLLGMRFVLIALGANPSSGFANFIYSVTRPFVAPFFDLFSYNEKLGTSTFEFETLIAMGVYALIMVVLAKIVALTSNRER